MSEERARCTGQCCAGFSLGGMTREALREKVEAGEVQDGAYILDMVIPLPLGEDGVPRFTCRWFDGVDCARYEDRPRMCSRYPYGGECSYEGCTLRGGVGVVDRAGTRDQQ